MKISQILNKIKAETACCSIKLTDLFVSLFTAFICANFYTVSIGDFTDLEFIAKISPLSFFTIFLLVFISLWAVVFILKTTKIINWCFFLSSLILSSVLASSAPSDIYFNLGLVFVLVFVIKYVTAENRLRISDKKMSKTVSLAVTAAVFLVFTASVSYFTILKYYTYSNATFDFGIFCQMFEQMAKTGLPFTTIERGEYLSHFAVHFSPIYYTILPGYMIFRCPEFLLVMQAAIVGLGMFPLRRICLKLGFTPGLSAFAAIIYAVFPTMANGCFCDFHENKFLSVLILYMIYFALCEKRLGTLVFALLTLSVKEDAAIYVIAIAVWMLITKRRRIFALILCAVSVGYFIFACKMIELAGGDIMLSRIDNYYASPDGGFFDVIKTCVYDIGFLIKEVFSGADPDRFMEITYTGQKLEFVLWLCVPLLFMPFASKHTTHLVLLIPLLVINLMPDWLYQFNPNYQYTYGTAAILIASAMLTISEKTNEWRRRMLVGMFSVSLLFTSSLVSNKAASQVIKYSNNKDKYIETELALKTIPRDSSVTAYGFFVPHLYYIDELSSCPKYYGDYTLTDYVVLDQRYIDDTHSKKLLKFMNDDYELILKKGYAQIYGLIK